MQNGRPPFQPAIAFMRLSRRSRSVLGLAAATVVVAGAGLLGHRVGEFRGIEALRTDINHRADLFAANVEGLINRLAHVPATVQLNHDVIELFHDPAAPGPAAAVREYLTRLNETQRSLAVFVVDERGIVIGSSNPGTDDDSRLGEDLSYRPYFVEALSGRTGRHYAIGMAGQEPGYYFSHPVSDRGRVVGVAVVKVSVAPIVSAFPLLGTPALIADRNDVVVLSSRPEWLFSSMRPLTLDARVDLELTGMYRENRLGDFPIAAALGYDDGVPDVDRVIETGALSVTGRSGGLLVQGRSLDAPGWRLLVFSDLAPVRARAAVAAALSALMAAFLILSGLVVLQRRRIERQKVEAKRALERANAELERTVRERTQDLTDTNEELRREMQVRIQAEATLRGAQDDLVQAAKLAVLGQLATGITHELAQPLGAIRALAGNARQFMERGDRQAAGGNLAIIDDLVDRMGGIIQPLKTFARKSPMAPETADVRAALDSVVFLLQRRFETEGVTVQRVLPEGPVVAWCNRNRLEQVLLNLMGNAIDAMRGATRRELRVEAGTDADGRTRIVVEDSGSGLSADVLESLFTPFFTTKPAGSGLGLGLVISRTIAQDYGGELGAENRPEGGARFTLRLPCGATG